MLSEGAELGGPAGSEPAELPRTQGRGSIRRTSVPITR
jgi:hypothetical protein